MESLKELYRIGTGPSSSHTMGAGSAPRTALKKNTRRQTVFSSLCTVRSPKRAKAT